MTATEVLSDRRMEVDVQDGKHKEFFTRKTISLSDAERLLKSGVGIGYEIMISSQPQSIPSSFDEQFFGEYSTSTKKAVHVRLQSTPAY